VFLFLPLKILGHVGPAANPARFGRLPGQKHRNTDRDVPPPAQQGNSDPGLGCKTEKRTQSGITRFLNIFYCDDAKIIGPVRSARIYFLRPLQGYGAYPLYAHVGGANTPGPADALGEINDLGWGGYNDLNQFAVPFPIYYRDYERLPGRVTEHTMYSSTVKLYDYAKKERDLTNKDKDGDKWDADWTPWKFKDDAKQADRGKVRKISFGFWDNATSYNVSWAYDPADNSYRRSNGGSPHIDKNTGAPLKSKNVVVVLADESVAHDGYDAGQHMLYDVEGSGEALIFQDGNVIKGSWKKPDDTDMIRFYNPAGVEVELTRGKTWVEIVPTGNTVTY